MIEGDDPCPVDHDKAEARAKLDRMSRGLGDNAARRVLIGEAGVVAPYLVRRSPDRALPRAEIYQPSRAVPIDGTAVGV